MTACVALLKRAVDLRIRRPLVLSALGLLGVPLGAQAPASPALAPRGAAQPPSPLAAVRRLQPPPVALRVQSAPRGRWLPIADHPRWPAGDSALLAALRWQPTAPGVRLATLRVAPTAGQALWQFELVVVRLDPTVVRLRLHLAREGDGSTRPWDLDAAPAGALVALNAGQFTDAGPWGWIVYNGRELQPPGSGSLAGSLVIDSTGRVQLVDADAVASARRTPGVQWALQSFPAVLTDDGAVPAALRTDGLGVDRTHRDARLVIGTTRDGALLVVLTRFGTLGAVGGRVPLGPTTPEMALLLGALGAQRALMLDGGLSAQLLVRAPGGAPQRWPGLRQVPVGLIALPTDRGPAPPRRE